MSTKALENYNYNYKENDQLQIEVGVQKEYKDIKRLQKKRKISHESEQRYKKGTKILRDY